MSHKTVWMVIVAALVACGASFWSGQYFASTFQGSSNTNTGTLPMVDTSQTNKSESSDTSSNEMACSLTPEELNAQRKQLIPGLFQRAEKVEDITNGIRFRFAPKPKLVTELATLIEKERVCCSFLSFQLVTDKGEGPITLEVTGPAGTTDMLRKL